MAAASGDFAPPLYELASPSLAPPIVTVAPTPGQGVALNTSSGAVPLAATVASLTVYSADDSNEAHFVRTTYGAPDVSGSAGPTVTGVPDGTYELDWGASIQAGASETIFMAVSVNGATPVDGNAIETQSSAGHDSCSRGLSITLATGGNNTLSCVYKTTLGHDSDARKRWIRALKVA